MARAPEGTGDRTYLCIDLKSFYASVEAADRGLDPFTTNLVVADPERSANTICLAITPALKAAGVRNRCRLRDIPAGIEYITAVPRMRRYMEVSGEILQCYLRFVSAEDMHVYSIDECFIDATPYLRLYRTDAKTFARRLMRAALEQTGVTATAGIGPNMFLCKVALDICAKHAPDGIGILDEDSFKREIWFHRPITDVWGIGAGTARRLARHGVVDLAGVAAMNPKVLRREFGKRAEVLIDHAWGLEACTIAQARTYKPHGHSITNGQVLMRDYTFEEAEVLIREMTLASALELAEKGLAASCIGLSAGYAGDGARRQPSSAVLAGLGATAAGGSRKLARPTASTSELTEAMLTLWRQTVDSGRNIRRIQLTFAELVDAASVQPSLFDAPEDHQKEKAMTQAMVAVRARFGANAALMGTSLRQEANARSRNQQIGGHRA